MHRDYRSYFISLITHSLRAAEIDYTIPMFENLFFEEHQLKGSTLRGRFLDLHMVFTLRNDEVRVVTSEFILQWVDRT